MKTIIGAIVLLIPVFAQAHSGHGGASSGFWYGMVHTLSGLDHLLMLLAGGLWLSQLRLQSKLLGLASFAVLMMVSVLLGSQYSLVVNWSLLATFVVMASFLVATRRWYSYAGVGLMLGATAMFGGAHGVELANLSALSVYTTAGVLLSSIVMLSVFTGVLSFIRLPIFTARII